MRNMNERLDIDWVPIIVVVTSVAILAIFLWVVVASTGAEKREFISACKGAGHTQEECRYEWARSKSIQRATVITQPVVVYTK